MLTDEETSRPSARTERWRMALVWGLVVGICAYYFWSLVPLRLAPQHQYYNMLADAFEAGSLSLLEKPSPELLKLPDPYDPIQNEPYRLHDASLYKGKYYLYFGPVPALVLFWPLHALFGFHLPQDLAVALFLSGGLASVVWILRILMRVAWPNCPAWVLLVGISALGFCTGGTFLLAAPSVYAVAIAGGYFFALMGLALILSDLSAQDPAWWKLALGSICAGLAVGARPNYVIFVLILPVLWLLGLRFHGQRGGLKAGISTAVALFVPFVGCVTGLLAYNHARFGSMLEFGMHYQLAGFHPQHSPILQPAQSLQRLGRYLLAEAAPAPAPPFLHLKLGPEFGEPELGSLFLNPLGIFALGWFVYRFVARACPKGKVRGLVNVLLGFAVIEILLLSVITHASVVRYHLDFEPCLLLAGIVAWCDAVQASAAKPHLRRLIRGGGFILAAIGIWAGFAAGYNEIAPAAIRRFYSGNDLVAKGEKAEAVASYQKALSITPDFSLAEMNLAQVLATMGEGAAAARHFTHAVQTSVSINRAYHGQAYLPSFVGLCVYDPLNEYYKLCAEMLRRGQMTEALAALDGMVRIFHDQGYAGEGGRVLESLYRVATASHQTGFATQVEQRLRDYGAAVP